MDNQEKNGDWRQLRISMMHHIDIQRLGLRKIVATPRSGQEPKKMLNTWLNLDKDNQNYLIHTIHKG